MPHQDYYRGGEKWPSVSEVLHHRPKPWVDKWKERWGILAIRKTVYAGRIGTAFHEGAERLSRLEDVELPKNKRLAGMLVQVCEWLRKEQFVPKHTEFHVISEKYKYHGTLDATGTIAKYGDVLVLIDYKSSSAIYAEMAEQLAAYAEAYFETTGVRIKIGLIVHVSKDKPHHVLTVKEYKLTKHVFNKFLKRLEEYYDAQATNQEATGC